MAISPKQQQAVRDAEAKASTEDIQRLGVDIVTSTPPMLNGSLSVDVWTATPGLLVPIDLGGRWMKLHSIKVPMYVVTGDTVLNSVGLYELATGTIGSKSSPSDGVLTARCLSRVFFSASLTGSGDVGTTFLQVFTLLTDILLDPTKQYFVWLDKDSPTRGLYLTPTELRIAYAVNGGTRNGARPPDYLTLTRNPVTSTIRAPFVELRSRYGSFMYGDPAVE